MQVLIPLASAWGLVWWHLSLAPSMLHIHPEKQRKGLIIAHYQVNICGLCLPNSLVTTNALQPTVFIGIKTHCWKEHSLRLYLNIIMFWWSSIEFVHWPKKAENLWQTFLLWAVVFLCLIYCKAILSSIFSKTRVNKLLKYECYTVLFNHVIVFRRDQHTSLC